jgi:quercetin dioxygenase-like cupin family protein
MFDDEIKDSSLPMLLGLVLATLVLFVPPASAQSNEQERTIVWTADDAALEWSPCPEFLPHGCELAVLHGDPSQANTDVFFKVPARAQLPLHWHTSAERMLLVAGELHVSYEGQQPVILKPGTYAYGPAKRAHGGSCVSATPCVLFIAFESPVDAIPAKAESIE